MTFVDRSGRILLTNHEQELSVLPPSVGTTDPGDTFEIFHLDGRPYHATEWPVLRSARTGEVIVGEQFFRFAPDGSRTSFSCNCAPFYDDQGAIAGAVWVARDVTERQRTHAALQMRSRQQASLAELTLRNLADGDLQALLDDAAALVARTLELDLIAVGENLSDDAGVAWRAGFGWRGETITQSPPDPADARSLVGHTLLADDPVISGDVRADERFEISDVIASQGPVSLVAVVIPGERGPFGVLVAGARGRREFSSEDVDFVTAVANVVGAAVERSRIGERMDEVRESLRLRIARELHDDALRELTDALTLAVVARSAAGRPDEVAQWEDMIDALQRVGQHLRGAVYDLRLTADEGRDFRDLLSELVAVQAGKAGSCRLWLTGGHAIPAGPRGRHGTEVLRIVQEALMNARLHSGASMIEVDASASTADAIRLVVDDDGDWPDRDRWRAAGRGAGIAGMVERADALGAQLRIEARPDGGTRVSLELASGTERASG